MNHRTELEEADYSSCPRKSHLLAWLAGNIELDETESQHVSDCPQCLEWLESYTAAPELRSWIRVDQPSSNEYASELELHAVCQSLAAISARDTEHAAASEVQTQADEVGHRESCTVDSPVVESGAEHESFGKQASPDTQPTGFPGPAGRQTVDIAQLQSALPSGRYHVDCLLASGGSGEVYLAFDNKLSRNVAIKVLVRESIRERQRLLREAKILAELDHPHLIQVFDIGELGPGSTSADDGTPALFMVLEYLPGGALDAYVPDGYQRLGELLYQAAEGLAAAHRHGLVHRDVKPSNLLMDATHQRLKVADFGLARFVDADTTVVTRTGDFVGTPAYMSPEQLRPDEPLDPATDVYSLGATLYQLLTGQPPFQGGTAVVLRPSNAISKAWSNCGIPFSTSLSPRR